MAATTLDQNRSDAWDEPSTWEPGDPLYEHPNHVFGPDTQYVRFLYDLLDDDGAAARNFTNYERRLWNRAACDHCLVSWHPRHGGNRCWSCGRYVPKTWDESELEDAA